MLNMITYAEKKGVAKGVAKGVELCSEVVKYLEKHPTASNAAIAAELQCSEEDVVMVRKAFGI